MARWVCILIGFLHYTCERNSTPNPPLEILLNSQQYAFRMQYTGLRVRACRVVRYIGLFYTVAPEIEMEHSVMHTGMGCETQLVCIVHSEPPSKVIWYKDNRQLGSTDHHSHQVSLKTQIHR